jgi:hypothetical protein
VHNTGPVGIHVEYVRRGEQDENTRDGHGIGVDYTMPEPPAGDDPDCE